MLYTPSHKAAPGNFATAVVTEIAPDVEDSRFIQLSLARLDRFERPIPLSELKAGITQGEPAFSYAPTTRKIDAKEFDRLVEI